MRPKILVINGHPDPSPARFCAALSRSYAEGAQRAGAATMLVDMRCVPEEGRPLDVELRAAISSADRMAFVFPLWASEAPPALQRFLELALDAAPAVSARTVVTMDLPSLFYRGKTGFMPLRDVESEAREFIGSVDHLTYEDRTRWLARVAECGEKDGRRIGERMQRQRWFSPSNVRLVSALRAESRFA